MKKYPQYSFVDLHTQVIPTATSEERLALTRVFDAKANSPLSHVELAEQICRNGGNGMANALRGGRGVPYIEVLSDTVRDLKIEKVASLFDMTSSGVTLGEMDARYNDPLLDVFIKQLWSKALEDYIVATESAILGKVAADIYTKMTPEQQAEVNRKFEAVARSLPDRDLRKAGTAGALLVMGNLGGFATYTLMSTVMSAVSMGTLGFGAYTAASSILSVVLGPVGIVGVGAVALYQVASPNARKSLQAIATITMVRQRKLAKHTLELVRFVH